MKKNLCPFYGAVCLTLLVLLLGPIVLPCWASAEDEKMTAALSSPRTGPGTNDFRKGVIINSVAIGGGIGAVILGSEEAHSLVLGYASRGRILSGTVGKGWYRGNAEGRIEFFFGGQVSPENRCLGGFTPVLRYDFVRRGNWSPFFDLGVGLTLTDIREPDLSTAWEFNLVVGGGAHYFFGDNKSLSLQYRAMHMSNAGAHLPNNGTNTNMFIVGLNWFH